MLWLVFQFNHTKDLYPSGEFYFIDDFLTHHIFVFLHKSADGLVFFFVNDIINAVKQYGLIGSGMNGVVA